MFSLDLVRRALIVAMVLCLSACADITHERAIAITRAYIDRHHLPLPTGYQVQLSESDYIEVHEGTGYSESFPAYIVMYTIERKELYRFTLQRNAYRVHRFEDQRSMNGLQDVR